MLSKNLFLLEYMVKRRMEEDNKRLKAINNLSELLLEHNIELDSPTTENKYEILRGLTKIKGGSLHYLEKELIDEMFKS